MFLFLPQNMIDGKYLLLGTNLGDKKANLSKARGFITRAIGNISNASSIYETAAWGKTDQPSFLNQVVQVATDLSPLQVLEKIEEIEKCLGRERIEKWGERIIDIDILYYEKQVIDIENLQIPHTGIPNRRFTLIPLVEIAANFVHPVLELSNQQLLERCEDDLQVRKLD